MDLEAIDRQMKNHSVTLGETGQNSGGIFKGSNILKGLQGLSDLNGFKEFYRAITGLTDRKSIRGLSQSDDPSSSHTQPVH